jgi:MerR family transcriptional regulator, light-induced transcriptional regulator
MAIENSDPEEFARIAADTPVPPGAPDPRRPRSEQSRRAALVSTLEGEIVPRLLMLCRADSASIAGATGPADATDPGDVEELARLLLAHGPEMAYEFAEVLRHRGVTHDRIFLDLLAQAAFQLAERWESQDLDYPELMQGLGALQKVVKRYQ